MRQSFASIVVLLFLLTPLNTDQYHNSLGSSSCKAKYVYDHILDLGRAQVVAEWDHQPNSTPFPATVTLTEETTKSVTVTTSVSLEASAKATIYDVIELSVKATLDTTVQTTVTTTTGLSFAVTIPPGWEAEANFGVQVHITTGHLYTSNCPGSHHDYGIVRAFTPYGRPDWCPWARGPDRFDDENLALYRGLDPSCTPAPPL